MKYNSVKCYPLHTQDWSLQTLYLESLKQVMAAGSRKKGLPYEHSLQLYACTVKKPGKMVVISVADSDHHCTFLTITKNMQWHSLTTTDFTTYFVQYARLTTRWPFKRCLYVSSSCQCNCLWFSYICISKSFWNSQ